MFINFLSHGIKLHMQAMESTNKTTNTKKKKPNEILGFISPTYPKLKPFSFLLTPMFLFLKLYFFSKANSKPSLFHPTTLDTPNSLFLFLLQTLYQPCSLYPFLQLPNTLLLVNWRNNLSSPFSCPFLLTFLPLFPTS